MKCTNHFGQMSKHEALVANIHARASITPRRRYKFVVALCVIKARMPMPYVAGRFVLPGEVIPATFAVQS